MTPIDGCDSSACSGRIDHRPRHLPRPSSVDELADSATTSATSSRRGTTVAHCPTVFTRRGITMQSFGGYIAARRQYRHRHRHLSAQHARGDAPRASSRSRIVAKDVFDLRTTRLLQRGDARRRQGAAARRYRPARAGRQADLVMVDVTHPMMRPLRDPIRSLIYAAADRAVRHVFVDGAQVVADGRVTTMDYERRAWNSRKRSGGSSRWCGSSTGRSARMPSFRRWYTGGTHSGRARGRAAHVVALAQQNVTDVVRSSADAARVAAW